MAAYSSKSDPCSLRRSRRSVVRVGIIEESYSREYPSSACGTFSPLGGEKATQFRAALNWVAFSPLRGEKVPKADEGQLQNVTLETHPHTQSRAGRRCANHGLAVLRIRGNGVVVVGFGEAPALIEQDRALGVEDVEDVEQYVHGRGAERDRVAEVEIDVVVVRRAAFRTALRKEEFIAAVRIGVAVARERRTAAPIRRGADR